MQAWSVVAAFSVVAPVVFQGRLAMGMWPWFPGTLGLGLGGLVQAVSAYPMAFPVYAAFILTWSLTEALAALFLVAGDRLALSTNRRQVQEVAHRHADLCHLSKAVAALLENQLTVMTVGMLLTPALSTVMAVKGTFDVFCATSIPFLLPFYIMCRAGERLEDASRSMSQAAYTCFSNSLDPHRASDDTREHRVLLVMMTRAARQTSMEVFRGTVRYNLHTCHEAFKSWYSMLQYLLNAPDGS
ncbi:uncharacterized protein LOC117644584 [Thrips palmi]|uniref:Uncharacterized protein LOC117644584 n=1 Tax=Thrips palmi TaxID=161013 RepID=A0A6P8Z0G1_THRPL|nr:uncharacterized protein LOC117644584 [Thrips palmi]